MTQVAVSGDRHWRCYAVACEVVGRLARRYGGRDLAGLLVHHGDATGVDAAFAEACRSMGVGHREHEARWSDLDAPGARVAYRKDGTAYNANAGPDRNRRMAESGIVLCICVHRNIGRSKGTRNMASTCIGLGIPVWLVSSSASPVSPVRIYGFRGAEAVTEPIA